MILFADYHFSGLVQGGSAKLVEVYPGTAVQAFAVPAIPVQLVLSLCYREAFYRLSYDIVDS